MLMMKLNLKLEKKEAEDEQEKRGSRKRRRVTRWRDGGTEGGWNSTKFENP